MSADALVLAQLDRVLERFEGLETQLADPDVLSDQTRYQQVAIARSELEPVVRLYRQYRKLEREVDDTGGMLALEADPAMKAFLEEERGRGQEQLAKLGHELRVALLPKDPLDAKDTIIEIRAGTGGDEAALFAADMYRMYSRYAEGRRWKQELLSSNATGIGGFKEVIFSLRGQGVYSRMKFESGVHRVQRIPVTEASGRIHTSTITVAVLPEAEEVDVKIEEKDLRIDIMRSGGPGGQSVNTTDSAVRIVHLPTGLIVICQDEKSQHKNKAKALRVLRARLLEAERERQAAERSSNRRSQVGTGERSERIRTYNFPQGRVTDHRIGLTLHRIKEILDGDVDELIEALTLADQERALQELSAG
ncbi:MAG: peptide chain release factor 1 [Candidatus Riflebacteria bacterium]|nr:peptide chain release factor 1 [Candidatus Riflebacteria bacterium]